MSLPKKTILQAVADFNIVPPKEEATPTLIVEHKDDNIEKNNDRNISGNNNLFWSFLSSVGSSMM